MGIYIKVRIGFFMNLEQKNSFGIKNKNIFNNIFFLN